MSAIKNRQKGIRVYAHWLGMKKPVLMGILCATPSRGKEVFSFEYSRIWLNSPYVQMLDPNLGLFSGPQYAQSDQDNFGLFLDSSPDRWGRNLMQRREVQLAKTQKRDLRVLVESDYLLGVHDDFRMGGLRFRLSENTPFLDAQTDMAAPPWTKLRDLEYASLQLEEENAENHPDYMKWLMMLIAPGGSLGGARPKAGVLDPGSHPWIAKFPGRNDEVNIGKWEYLVWQLARSAGIETVSSDIRRFSGEHDTFLTRRFDRTESGERIHFASAMMMLGKKDGDSSSASYLDLAGFLIRNGAQVNRDLEQLWRRIVFYVCVSNTDDHLRNHGFLLGEDGWALSPAFDINPVATGNGLTLNISEYDNSQDIELVRSVASVFRINPKRSDEIIAEVRNVVRNWMKLAKQLRLPSREISFMKNAFRVADR